MSAVAEAPLARKVVERASSGQRIRELVFRLGLLSCLWDTRPARRGDRVPDEVPAEEPPAPVTPSG